MSSFSINRVVLIGNLTRDPELRSLPSGSSACNFRIGCNSTRRDAEGDFQEKPNFFDVTAFGTLAENVNRYTHKGSRVAIDGRLEWREWETADQQKRQAVSVIADAVLFLDNSGERSESDQPQDGECSDDFDVLETDQGWVSELGLRPASELVSVGERAEEDGLVF